MYVIVDGPTLSLLLYSHFNSKGKENGFLLGQRMEKVQSGITDSQIHTAEVHSYIYITSFIPWPHHKCLYGRNGHIDETLMNSILEGSDQLVVGWYSFRHQTSQMPSVKEFSIHTKLAQTCRETKAEEFVFLLCTSLANRNLSTHSSDHTFMIYRHNRFMNIPMKIKNLGDTSKMEYVIENSSPATSKVINANMGSSGKNFISASGQVKQVTEMKNLVSSMTKGLEMEQNTFNIEDETYAMQLSTQTKVNKSEAVLGLLDAEVSVLRDRVALLEKEEMQRAFLKAELRKQKEEEERKQQERNREAEEEEQLNKLLMDLELVPPVENGSSSQKDQNSALAPVPAIISFPKLEAGVNPLYVSTLREMDEPDASLGGFDLPDSRVKNSIANNIQTMGKVQLLNNSEIQPEASGSSRRELSQSKNPQPSSAFKVQGKPKDPFDFVTDQVESELKINKQQGRQSRNVLQNLPRRELEVSRSPSPSMKPKAVATNRIGAGQSDAAKTNGHVAGDEHDGPGPSSTLALPDDGVTVSSSPVF